MARPKSATHDIKRDAILDIAAQCFAQRSYPAASMNEIATACGTSKARLYHYYDSKEAILFDLLDRHTQRLLAVIAQTEAAAQRKDLNDTQFLSEVPDAALGSAPVSPRELILNRQRDIVAAMTRFMKRAYPERLTPTNQTALTMMLLGMINWTFTWLRPGGPISYAAFADEVIGMLEKGLG
jgi:AcrR family transcriptional regulator